MPGKEDVNMVPESASILEKSKSRPHLQSRRKYGALIGQFNTDSRHQLNTL
jgi:hypothetical protein